MRLGVYINSRANRVIKEMRKAGVDLEELYEELFLVYQGFDSVAEIEKDLKERIEWFEFTKAQEREMEEREDSKAGYIVDKLQEKIEELI